MHNIHLTVCGCHVALATSDANAHTLLRDVFGVLQTESDNEAPRIDLTITRDPARDGGYLVQGDTLMPLQCADAYELIYHVDKELTLSLQRRQTRLLFIHAGAVERHGRAIILAAPSGTGKSTLTYALLHAGFRYLSDELAPIDLEHLHVAAYPHALCLKASPPDPYRLPAHIIRTRHTLHIPIDELPASTLLTPQQLGLILLLHRTDPTATDRTTATSRRLSAAEAATRLYVNSLNALAHAGDGLDAILGITRQVPCYELNSSELTAMADTIDQLLGSPD